VRDEGNKSRNRKEGREDRGRAEGRKEGDERARGGRKGERKFFFDIVLYFICVLAAY